jgi:hypothetical protein
MIRTCTRRHRLTSLFFLLGVALVLAPLDRSNAGATDRISKVNYHYLTANADDQISIDPMIRFERRHLLHGANTLAEQRARYGSYFTVFWEAADRTQPVTLRFEYRSLKTGAEVRSKELEVPTVKRKNVSKISVAGEEFANNGKVVDWRASVVRGGAVVATYESFLWD